MSDFVARARGIVAASAKHLPPAPSATPLPPDLEALFSACDGLDLADGTRILSRTEIPRATAWLAEERSLEWGPELWVIGERDDLVILRDLDPRGARRGGGVLEAATDGLTVLAREALDVIGYLEERLGVATLEAHRAPERVARDAARSGDEAALSRAIARGFYPGAPGELARASLSLGVLLARRGELDGAMAAFGAAVEARVASTVGGAGAREAEAKAAWRACAVAARKASCEEAAQRCEAPARGGLAGLAPRGKSS